MSRFIGGGGIPADTNPPQPDNGKQWVDTSQSPPEVKIYDSATQAWLPADTKTTVVSQTEPTPEVGKIWFEPAIGGTNMYAASSTGWGFLKFLSAIPGTVLDDFESGNLNPKNSDWGSWSGDTGASNVQNSVVLEGSRTLEQGTKSIFTTYQNGEINPTRVSCLFRQNSRSGSSGNEINIQVRKNGTAGVEVEFEQDGSFDSIAGNWSTQKTYRVIFDNIDWQNHTYDLSIRDTQTASVITSVSGRSFSSNISGWNDFRLRIDSGKCYFDLLEYSL